ncbi:MAG TPA: Ig-like domain-containing protein [Gemmataceae bacterium]|jgi:hypothetical protein
MRQSKPRRRQPNRFIPVVLNLEDRTVPSGNVTAVVVGGTLWVTGDGAANKLLIGSVGRDVAGVTPLDNTTVNGVAGPAMLGGVVNGYVIDMGGGDDVLGITGDACGGNLWINMGDGNDALLLGGADIRGPVAVAMGAGNDTLTAASSAFGNLTAFDGGAGTDTVTTAGASFRQTPILIGFEPAGSSPTTPTNPAGPTANNDTATVTAGSSVDIDVAANDSAGTGALQLGSITITQQPTAGHATPNGDGTVTYQSTGTTAGTDSFKYTIQDSAGGVSNPATVTVTINAPTAPTVAVTTTAPNPTNTSPIPFTATFSQAVTGFSAGGVTVTSGNGTVSNFTAVNGTTYTFNVTPTGQGTVTVAVAAGSAQNSTGQANQASAPVSVTFDTTAPAAPVVTGLSQASDSGTQGDGVTNVASPTVVGTAEAGAKVQVVAAGSSGNTTLGTPTADTNGNWSVTPTTPLTDGTYTVTAIATDAAGNTGPASAGFSLTIDTTPPAAPVVTGLSPASDSGTPGDGITNVASPTIVGTAEAGATVQVIAAGGPGTTPLGTVTADAGGNWTVTPTTPLADGTHIVTATATDAAANNGPASAGFNLTIDTTAPSAPISPTSAAAITGTSSDATSGVSGVDVSISNGTDFWSGTAFDSPNEVFLPATTTDNWANWSFAFAPGNYTVRARATDAAGNQGFDSSPVVVT